MFKFKIVEIAIFILIICSSYTLTWGNYNCPGLYIGTTLGGKNVVNNGKLDPLWNSNKNSRKVVRRDSEFFYIMSMTHALKPTGVKIKQNSNDHLTTLYNLKDERPHEHTLTIMYSCKLTPVYKDTAIKLTIQPEGCPPLEFDYIKTCGAEFRPHPGIVVTMTEGNNSKTIVRDGIVLFNEGSKDRPVDRILRNFEVDSDQIDMKMIAKITPELERIFDLEAGRNPRLMTKLKEKALNHILLAPVLSYDESIIQVLATGTFSPSVNHLNQSNSLQLNLKLRCMTKQDAYINVVFPLPNTQSISFILTRHCKEALSPLHEMSKEVQEQNRLEKLKNLPPQGRVGVPHPPLSPITVSAEKYIKPKDEEHNTDRRKHHYFFSFLIILGLAYYLFKFDANQTKLRKKREKDLENNAIFDGDELKTVRGSVHGVNLGYGTQLE